MTNEECERLTDALVRKHELGNPRSAYPPGDDGDREHLRNVVMGTIADTVLVVEDGIPIESFVS